MYIYIERDVQWNNPLEVTGRQRAEGMRQRHEDDMQMEAAMFAKQQADGDDDVPVDADADATSTSGSLALARVSASNVVNVTLAKVSWNIGKYGSGSSGHGIIMPATPFARLDDSMFGGSRSLFANVQRSMRLLQRSWSRRQTL